MANQSRGEVEVELCGKKYVLKPEFEGLLEAEDKIGKPLTKLFVEWGTQKRMPGLREVASLIYGGLIWHKNHRGENLTFEEIGKQVTQTGITHLYIPVIQFLRNALVPPSEEKEEKEHAKKNVKTEEDLT